jgi:hypothetical protein
MKIGRMASPAAIKTAAIFFAFMLHWRATADVPLDSGLAAFRAVTTNLDGSGITVAQSEASLTTNLETWQVNPAAAEKNPSIFTFTSFSGTTNVFPNAIGFESSHADTVAGTFYGIPDGLSTNVARVDTFEADFYVQNYLGTTNSPPNQDSVVNQSFTFGPLDATNQAAVDSAYDNFSVANQTLFISAANNLGNNPVVCAPGTSYDCISVGAYANGTYVNSIGPTSDNGRCKPDITAASPETSFSTPLVSGAATILLQAALRGDGGNDTNGAADMRTIKALLLNGAVKTPDWTNSQSAPLDVRYGAGVLNLLNAYEQLAGGEHHYLSTTQIPQGRAHPPDNTPGQITALSGWDFNTNSSTAADDTINHYYFRPGNGASGSPWAATITLVWNRQLNQTNINNLSLFLYNCAGSNLVLCSTSLVDNVQHIYVPQLPPGRYDLQIWKAGGIPGTNIVSSAEPYALAWGFVSPTLSLTRSGSGSVLAWSVYPAGFSAESTSNLASPVWTNNNLSGARITNGQYFLPLNPINPAEFFRLSSQ